MGSLVNVVGRNSSEFFLQALLESITDVYDKHKADSVLVALYETLAEQFNIVDREISATRHDNFISVEMQDEEILRSVADTDHLAQEGAIAVTDIRFTPSSSPEIELHRIVEGQTSLVLQSIPSDPDNIIITRRGDNDYVPQTTVTTFDAATNAIVFESIAAGDYNVLYISTGTTTAYSEFVEAPAGLFGSNPVNPFPINLTYTNLIPTSEVIVIPGGQHGTLTEGTDYTVDYVQGIIYLVLDYWLNTVQDKGLYISYRYDIDFADKYTLCEHIPVFSETATYLSPNQVTVQYAPIQSVRRIFNVITKEELEAAEVRDNIITLASSLSFRTVTGEEATIRTKALSDKKIAYQAAVTLPEGFDARLHALIAVSQIQATSDWLQLIRGGRDIVQDSYTLTTTLDVLDITLHTGGTILRRCTARLLLDVHYTIATSSALTQNEVTITFTEVGKTLIGSNSVYYYTTKRYNADGLSFEAADENSEHRVSFLGQPLFEDVMFEERLATSAFIRYFYTPGQRVDIQVAPRVIVASTDEAVVYIENEDYVVDYLQHHIVRIEAGDIPKGAIVRIFVEDSESLVIDYTFVADSVTIDYDYGINSIDWSPSYRELNVKEQGRFNEGQTSKLLKQVPVDFTTVSIYEATDTDAQVVATPTGYNDEEHLLFFEPALETGEYIFEYTARLQPFLPYSTYYVSYTYGARRDALLNHFAKFVHLEDVTILREEKFEITSLQNKVALSFDPLNIDDVLIYNKGDTSKSSLTTATFFNAGTKELVFNPIGSSGTRIVEYRSLGVRTKDLRKMVAALFDAFLSGPTKQTIIDFCVALFGLEPEVTRVLDRAFRIREQGDIEDGDRLVPLEVEASEALDDGSPSIDFLPSRFNTGLVIESQNGAFVRFDPLQNIAFDEGTLEFLFGNNFDGNDRLVHYFFDVAGTGAHYNRLALYKNSHGLLVFEAFGGGDKLLRSTIDINRIRQQEVFYLNEGDTSVQLTHRPASTLVDLDENEQQDIFAADPTEFIIAPLPIGEQDPLPLSLTFLITISDFPEYETVEVTHNTMATRLRELASTFELHGGKLSVHSELSFIKGCALYDDVLSELVQRGHEVGIHVDVPDTFITEREKELYIRERKAALEELLGYAIDSIDGDTGLLQNIAPSLESLGFKVASNFVDSVTGNHIVPFRTHPFRPSAQDYAIEDPNGILVHVPGDTALAYTRPLSSVTFAEFTLSLQTALSRRSKAQVSSWYIAIDIETFTESNLANELALFENWLTNEIDFRISSREVEWRTVREILDRFLFVEQFTVDAGYSYNVGYSIEGEPGNVGIRALTFDGASNALTFDPILYSGYYVFDYIAGWSKYEETEHFVAAVWKLHARDAQPPFVRLYLDGAPQVTGRFDSFS